ncbi:MAG: DNA polymerase IV [Deltaproteobacteria bacterium]|nr:DNA polymerase IV [Deltaproteobacteria bacterium]
MKRRILHIDMDAFFAAVEQKRRPELAGKPVVIGGRGDPSQRGVVSTANYEARKYGVHSAMPMKTAYKMCPHAVFLPVDYEAYSSASVKFKEVLRTVSPVMEDVGIDEAYLDVTDMPDTHEEITGRIKAGIKEKTGLTCSIGIAPNKLLAKIASEIRKPDGVTVLMEADVETKLWPLPVRKLYGIGPKTEELLKGINIETIGQLAALPLEKLQEHFGNSYGQYLHEAARGVDNSPLVTHWEPKSFSRETTFQEDMRDWQVIARKLAALSKGVVQDMRGHQYKARTITIKIRFSDFETFTRAMTISDYTDSEEEIRKAAFACLKRIELKKRVRLVGVRVSNFQGKDKDDQPHSEVLDRLI